MIKIDPYMHDIAEKSGSSAILAELALKTLDREFVHQVAPGKNGLSLLKIPESHVLVAHSSGGDYRITEPGEYSRSVFLRLIKDARRIGAEPIAVAEVIDARASDESFAKAVGVPFTDLALEYRVAKINGELAKLGPMVNCDCNMSATMLSMVRKGAVTNRIFEIDGTKYFMFDPKGNYVGMNSDGVGTKSLINGRFGKQIENVDDLLAMQFDDKGKYGGGAVVSMNLVETTGAFPFERVNDYAMRRARRMGAHAIMQRERIGNRLAGIHGEKNVYNMSGTLVSLFDEETLRNPPAPRVLDTLIAIKGGGRSNGFTDRRNLMVEWFGNDWHKTQGGKYFGEFLTRPSLIFYPVFAEMISRELATSVYHMSGGAFRDKLSKPIAKHGLYAEIGLEEESPRLFKPDPREAAIAAQFNIKDAYAKFAMGNEGFVTTDCPDRALQYLSDCGFEARAIGKIDMFGGKVSGIKLRAHNGDIIDYTVKSA